MVFDAGKSDLLPVELDKLGMIAAEPGPRADLALDVEGRFDSVSDTGGLRCMKMDVADREAPRGGR